MAETLILEFDGGSRGNPGPAGIGCVVRGADGTAVAGLGRFIGTATNNVAEYRALIEVMRMAREMGATSIAIRGDSELVVRQMNGQYKVKNVGLKPLFEEARELFTSFAHASIAHNYRSQNETGDALANQAMTARRDVTLADLRGQ